MSDKLGPAVRKQKTNTFKLLEVMHKYLSAIHAGLDCEQSLYFLQLATRVSACVFSRVLFDGLRKKRDCSSSNAGSSRERLRVQISLVYTFHVLFASFSVKKPFMEKQCLRFSFLYQKKSVRIKKVKRDD